MTNELREKIKNSSFIARLEVEVLNILRRFEKEENPVIYDEERETRGRILKEPPWQEMLLRSLGFLEMFGGRYDYRKSVLNKEARKEYERLKQEGYY